MRHLPLLVILITADVISGYYDASESGPVSQTVSVGSKATIAFATDNETTVEWTLMDSHVTVGRSANSSFTLLADSAYYSTEVETRTIDGDLRYVYKLHVTAGVHTAGVYRCAYSSESDSGNAYFSLGLTAATAPDVLPGTADFVGCCNASGVSPGCRPACQPSRLNFSSFNFEACAAPADLHSLRRCAMRRQNHVRCCLRRGVAGPCLELCLNGSASATPNVSGCMARLREIVQCFYEGQEAIPSPPRHVFVETLNRTAIVVHWNIPLKNTAYLTGYQVFYKLDGASELMSKYTEKTTLKLKLTNLEINKRYILYVQASGTHGSSYPSTMVSVSTVEEYFYTRSGNKTVDECCQSNGVGNTCRTQLCAGIPRRVTLSQVFQCMKDWPRIVKCFAGGRDHTACCKTNRVAPACVKYCSGKELDITQADLTCMTNFRVISSCFDAGVRTIPSPPRSLQTTIVLGESIGLKWEVPADLGDKKAAVSYVVVYRNMSAGGSVIYNFNATTTSATLQKLASGASYEISVVAKNRHGVSLPSASLMVTTHYEKPITIPAQKAYNPTKCCKASGVSAACQVECDLTRRVPIADSCRSNATAIAHCIADGRDHRYCCKRDSRINPNCYFMCSLDPNKALSISATLIWNCIRTSSMDGLRSCYASGHGILPSQPRSVRLMRLMMTSVQVKWDVPERFPNAKGYKIYMAVKGNAVNQTKDIDVLIHSANLSPLKSNTEYIVQVTAVTKDGYESLPSNSISFRTLPEIPLDWYKHKNPNFNRYNVTTCCRKKVASVQCQALCDPSNETTLLWTAEKAKRCVADLSDIVGCSSDGRNHRSCCQSRRVPRFCLSMCSGVVTANTTSSAVCVHFFPEVRSCFLDGYAILPKAPLVDQVRPLTQHTALIKFSKPPANEGQPKIQYYIYYRSYGISTGNWWMVRQNLSSPYTLDRLSTFTTYSFFLVAVSDNGTSLPSSVHNFTTFANSPFSLYIVANPSLKVKINDKVSLLCQAPAYVRATYTWYHDSRRVDSADGNLTLAQVSRNNIGQYVCVAEAMGKKVTRQAYLKVQFPINVIPRESLVKVGLYLTATIACTFNGFPDSVTWLDTDNAELMESANVLIRTATEGHHTVSEVKIVRVSSKSYGLYHCVGKNSYGDAKTVIRVADLSYIGAAPTLKPPGDVKNSRACCKKFGVRASCLGACDFGLSANFFENNRECMFEYRGIQHCLTDRRNHTTCCRKKNVLRQCWPLCSGAALKLDGAAVACFKPSQVQLTVSCMEEAARVLPTEPLSLELFRKTDKALTIRWKPPAKNSEYVVNYEVETRELKPTATPQTTRVGRVTVYTVGDLRPGHSYMVRVRALGINGSSDYASPIKAATNGPPEAPDNLHAELMGGVTVKLSWHMSAFSVVQVKKYSVFWSIEKSNSWTRNDTQKLELMFHCLVPEKKYKFQVAASNEFGQSGRSREEIVVTTENKNPYCETRKKKVVKHTSDMSSVVPVVAFLLVLVFGLGSAGLFIYMNRNNPRYAWPRWLRRLPGMQPTRQRLATQEFDNPVRFSDLAVGDDDESSRIAFSDMERRPSKDFGSLTSEA